jgi:hypothetical protein
VLQRAREADDGSWAPYADAIGSHPVAAVREAVLSLAGEGLLEVRQIDDRLEARLPG